MSNYRTSNYNVIFEANGKVVFVNLLTNAIATIDKERYDKINEIINEPNKDWKNEYEKLKNDLVYGGYLVEEDFDELQHLKMINYSRRFDSSSMNFTIMPTMKCNFDCIYCYESHEGADMNLETAEKVADYISEVAKNKRSIGIGWFGGEPLIKFDIMKFINEKVIKSCQEYKTQFYSSISTNGYLLSSEKAKLFDELKIHNVQITLDGPSEYHNKYRPLKGGGPTFDMILNNIKNLLESTKETKLSLRVNVGPDNYNAIPELLDRIEFLPKERMRVYFRWIFQGSDTVKDIHREVMNFRKTNSFEKLAEFYYLATEKGFEVFLPILSQPIYCEYDTLSAILIGPKAEIYPCTVAVNEGSEFGHINNKKIEYDSSKFLSWHKHNAFEDEVCKKCKLLPVCFGGCRNAIVNEGIRGCPEEATDIESFARLWYSVKDTERRLKVRFKNESIKI